MPVVPSKTSAILHQCALWSSGILIVTILGLAMGHFWAIAAPPATKYTPGETLNPTCAPGSTNCTVVPPAASGDNADITSMSILTDIALSGTDTLTVENTGTGNSFRVNDEASDSTPFIIDASGNVGIKANTPGEALHILSGNALLQAGSGQESAIKLAATGDFGGSGPPRENPIFEIGRIVQAPTDVPKMRVLYTDDQTSTHAIFEMEPTGTVASVTPSSVNRASHFEAFEDQQSEPYFRLNSSPDMQLEFGPGTSDPTDLVIARRETSDADPDVVGTHNPELSIQIGGTEKLRVTDTEWIYKTTGSEKARFNTDGFLGIGDTDPRNSISNAGGLSFTAPQTTDITADNQLVGTYNESYIRLTSDSTTATDRTFVLDWSQEDGHILILEWADATDSGELIDNSSANYLSGNWTPGYGDTITLIFNDNINAWMEISRSDN